MPRGARSAKRRGQALVEFAVVVTMLTVMVVGSLDFGRVVVAALALQNMARTGAQYGTIAASPAFGTAPDKETIRDRAVHAALAELSPDEDEQQIFHAAPTVEAVFTDTEEAGAAFPTPAIDPDTGQPGPPRCLITVTARYQYQPWIRVGDFPGPISLERHSTMRMLFVPPDMTSDSGVSCV